LVLNKANISVPVAKPIQVCQRTWTKPRYVEAKTITKNPVEASTSAGRTAACTGRVGKSIFNGLLFYIMRIQKRRNTDK
jgi:hypothetical protein